MIYKDEDLEREWAKVEKMVETQFGPDVDVQGILFLIGVQELGKLNKKFKKDEKLEVMHIAICTLLSRYGYYEYDGTDADGWPHYKLNDKLPPLKPAQQHTLMRQAIIEYFNESENGPTGLVRGV